LLTGGDLFATSIVVRRDSDYLTAVAANSQRDIIMYDDAGRITGREAIRVCKICQLADQGIFVAAGLATIDSCAIAKAISKDHRLVRDRRSVFADAVAPEIIQHLSALHGEILDYYTSGGRYTLGAVFVGTEQGVATYSMVTLWATVTSGGITITPIIEDCPGQCRPYIPLGSGAAEAFISTDRAALMKLQPIEFVRTVVAAAIERDPKVGGPISVGVVNSFTKRITEPGTCPKDQQKPN
jgi:hypothetical protein